MRIAIGSLRREVRLAILVGLLLGIGAIALHLAWRDTGIWICIAAVAMTGAFYLLAVRPSRIPRGAVLVVKLAGAMPPSVEMLRIVQIWDVDTQADGGVHVKNTKEIGKVTGLKTENKGKNNRRLYFTVD